MLSLIGAPWTHEYIGLYAYCRSGVENNRWQQVNRSIDIQWWYFLCALILVIWLQSAWENRQQVEKVPYSVFQELLDEGRLAEIHVARDSIRARIRQPQSNETEYIQTVRIDPELAAAILQHDVELSAEPDNEWLALILSWLLPAIFFIGIWLLIIRRIAGRSGGPGLMSVGNSKAKVYVEKDTKVTFDDVAGVDEAKEELREIVAFLLDGDS